MALVIPCAEISDTSGVKLLTSISKMSDIKKSPWLLWVVMEV
jgi:hypothetical protein